MSLSSYSPRRTAMITASLGLVSLFPPLATDMYLSAMGDVASAMNTSHAGAEFSLSIFFLGLCVGQLLMGPLLDGYGRRGPLLLGGGLFAATSVALPLVSDIVIFNGLRFVQALGASAGMVAGRAIVSDLYEGQRAAKVMTLLVMILTIGPVVSPTMGSLLLQGFGWTSIFAFMAVISAIAIAFAAMVLPETLPKRQRTNNPFASGLASASRVIAHREFLISALVAGLIQGGMFAFITGSSGVFQQGFGLNALQYGLVFALIAAALIVFGRVNSWLLNRFRPEQILRRGLPIFGLAAALVTLFATANSLWLIVAGLWVTVGMIGMLSANAMSISMEHARNSAGMGSALLGGIQFSVAFVVSSLVALAGTATPLSMCFGILIPAVLAELLSTVSRQEKRPTQALGNGSGAVG